MRPLHASARFLDPHTLQLERGPRARELTFRTAIVATGSRPFVPEIAGLETVDFLTTDTLFELEELPPRLAILGGGAAGVEIAQALARLGSAVTLVTHDDQLLSGVERDAAALLLDTLRAEGVEIYLRSTFTRLQQRADEVSVEIAGGGEPLHILVDRIILATGRNANTAGIGLEAAGVDYTRHGIAVDAYCRTNVRHIFASGDVTTAPNLTHVAENMSKAAALNALSRLPVRRYEQDVIPMVVYTDPEIATVGRTERALQEAGQPYDVIELPYEKIDRAVIEGRGTGFVRVYHRCGRVLGATIAGAQAGELIAEYALAMRHGLRLPALADTVHAYPTMMLGARRAADQIYPRALKPWMVRGLQLLYGLRGEIPEYIGSRMIV
jgi:pyruvate/2-oxoglutarate dehydrogenase complex dihydrolipoamide dehydrogenase (E3) component